MSENLQQVGHCRCYDLLKGSKTARKSGQVWAAGQAMTGCMDEVELGEAKIYGYSTYD